MNDELDWISLPAVLDLLKKHRPSVLYPHVWLRDHLKTGALAAKANTALVTDKGRISVAQSHHDWEIPSPVWADAPNDSYLDVHQDKFATTAFGTGFADVECMGLWFGKQQFMKLADIPMGSEQAAPPLEPKNGLRSAAGARPDAGKWAAFAAALAFVADREEIRADASDASIQKMVDDFLSAKGREAPGIDTTRDAIRMVRAWLHDQPFPGDNHE